MRLLEDLRPSVPVVKGLGAEVEVRYLPNEPARTCSLLKEVEFGLAGPEERREALGLVEAWHYRGRRIFACPEAAAVVRSFGVMALAVDRSGPGEAVFEQLVAELGANRVLGFKFTAESKAELLSGLKVLMEKGRLRLPYHRPLLAQLTAITCEMRPSGRLLRHPPRGHDDMVMALALACWAARRPRGAAVRLA